MFWQKCPVFDSPEKQDNNLLMSRRHFKIVFDVYYFSTACSIEKVKCEKNVVVGYFSVIRNTKCIHLLKFSW